MHNVFASVIFTERRFPTVARMAEQVDALVSKTSGQFGLAGSIPAPGTITNLSEGSISSGR